MEQKYNVDTGKFEPVATEAEVTIGWTVHAQGDGDTLDYWPFHDPWRAGQPQHEVTFTLTDPPLNIYDSVNPRAVCDAVFAATNEPDAAPGDDTVEGRIVEAIRQAGYVGREAHYSLSVGDTVTVNGSRYSYLPHGWAEDLTARTEEELSHLRMMYSDAKHPDGVKRIDAELRRRESDARAQRERQYSHLTRLMGAVRATEHAVDRVEELYAAQPRLTVKGLLVVLQDDRQRAADREDALRADMGGTWARDHYRRWQPGEEPLTSEELETNRRDHEATLSVRCPFCGADPGIDCVTGSGRRAAGSHTARERTAGVDD